MSLVPFSPIDRTEFKFVHRILYEGVEAVLPVAEQRQEVGFTMARVLASCAQMFRLFPQEHGQALFDAIATGADVLAMHGSYMNLVVNADHQIIQYDPIRLWQQCGEVAQSKTNIILSFVNEADQRVNRIDEIDRVMPIPGVLCSRGSNGFASDSGPSPILQFGEIHLNGGEWQRKSHNGMEQANLVGRPWGATEIARAADQDDNPNHYEDDAAAAALLIAWSTYHSQRGKDSTLWTNDANGHGELECAHAAVKGSRSVPLEFRTGAYSRPPNPNDQILRVYRRTLQDGRFHDVQVRV